MVIHFFNTNIEVISAAYFLILLTLLMYVLHRFTFMLSQKNQSKSIKKNRKMLTINSVIDD